MIIIRDLSSILLVKSFDFPEEKHPVTVVEDSNWIETESFHWKQIFVVCFQIIR